MILREWRGRAVPDYAAVPGHRNTWILVDDGPAVGEFVLLTLWDSRDAIRGFAGDDISRARYYAEDPQFLLEMPERLRHYDVRHAS